jgi:16S rRNA A1518/A1519 N6-dimethyltransferase RsmA/KsgA/DIM1 with predicted DNA glycosylase/AP lyase activity
MSFCHLKFFLYTFGFMEILKSIDLNINSHLQNVGLKPTLRAENLTVSDWCKLAEQIEKNK